MSMKSLEAKVAHLEIDLPIHPPNILDEGSSAVVYKYPIRNKDGAVKALRQQLSKRKILKVSIKLRELKHGNVVRFRGYSIRPSAFIFEFCVLTTDDGEDVHNLSQLINILNEEECFNFTERLNYIVQATCGLDYLHKNGIIHKDFKPSNILVSGSLKQPVMKVADFEEMADIKQTIQTISTINNLKGMTLAYTAPELCSGEMKPSFKSDSYSWATSSFEILCNQPSAWANVLSVLNDSILMNSILQNRRPNLRDLEILYNKDDSRQILFVLISKSWCPEQHVRPLPSEEGYVL